MANIQWNIRGVSYSNCNCAYGCPCQFNALPTHGHCRADCFVEIEQGHFGDVKLDGLRLGILGKWPGPIHEGKGIYMVVVDERGTPEQRKALEAIALGKETEPMATMYNIFHAMAETVLPTVAKPIEFKLDLDGRTATVRVPGMLDASAEPIKNPMTGAEHRARVTLPNGFEYTEAEYASGSTRATGPIDLDFTGTHAHLNRFHWSTNGVVR
jgi:hypothetical protein